MQLNVIDQKDEKRTKTKFPEWLRKPIPQSSVMPTTETVKRLKLNTVCEEARCPNRTECWSRRAATFMLLGDVCTRNCQYCSISHGKPLELDESEPERVAEAAAELGLKHVVLTSVNRDELKDGGSMIFHRSIVEIRKKLQPVTIEVLTPDFKGDELSIRNVCEASPEVYNHNIETVEELFPIARPGGRYNRSLVLLNFVKQNYPHILTKSGLMVGLGENDDQIKKVFVDLAKVGCDILTVGQYLKPDRNSLNVDRFVHPDEFEKYKEWALEAGIRFVYSGPYVRSSYLAEDVLSQYLNECE